MALRVDKSVISVGPRGQKANRDLIDHSELFERRLYEVRTGVWCYVGGGTANITFVEAPDGLIAIDSGESVEEAAEALSAVRAHTERPVVAMIWSHFHYVQGTTAFLEGADRELEIWAHDDSARLLASMGAEVGPVRLRGLAQQMGMMLPTDGADAMPNIGIGPFWKDPDRPSTHNGYLPPGKTVGDPSTVSIAGLDVSLTPVHADSEDTLVIWFPSLGACVNNHLWPALFNVFPLRGEPYRDPLVRLEAFDLMLHYAPDHLVGVHGPPISGSEQVRKALTDYRDAIQYLWDQTVRGMNAGLTLGELVESVQLPERFAGSYYTREFYGMVPHHVRQIHGGMRGWFDGDAVNLFQLPPAEEAERLVAGFGGRDTVLDQARAARADDDPAWAVQLATWLLRIDIDDTGAKAIKADSLRLIGQTTSAANVRSWCLTQASELEGSISLDRFRSHHTSRTRVLGSAPEVYVHALRVQLDPLAAEGLHHCVEWRFDDGTIASLRLRDGVAVAAGAIDDADTTLELTLDAWADIYSGAVHAATAQEEGRLTVSGDIDALAAFFAPFDQPHLKVAFAR